MDSRRYAIFLISLICIASSGCVVSIRTPVEEGPNVVELMIGETIDARGHEIRCKDINIFSTSTILSIDGVDVMVKELGEVQLPEGVDDIEVHLVTITGNNGEYSIELSIKEL